MSWSGPVTCPNCGSPIDSGASVCPYCYSSTPYDAPWQGQRIGESWWMFIPLFAGLAIFTVALASDSWFGTHWIGQLLELIRNTD